MRRHVVRRSPPNGSSSLASKSSSRRGRSVNNGFVLSRLAVAAFAAFAIVLLLGMYLYSLQAIRVHDQGSPLITLSSSGGDMVAHIPPVTPLRDVDLELYTIRINTWKRLEQLMVSIEHHATCPGVAQIQVVWCDEQGDPPRELEEHPKVVLERHVVNSLNERFHILEETPTMGILSIDDDVLRPCEAIDSGFFKWTRNPHRMVGFDARTHVVDKETGTWKYGYMSTTEKSNQYSLSLLRYCFIHRDYLNSYMKDMPRPIFDHVAEIFNCEDIAMSLWISSLTEGSPPLLADTWSMKSLIKLYSPETISGTHGHKQLRDACVNSFSQQLGLKGILKKATIEHKEDPFFECGAPGDDKAPANWRVVDRHAALLTKIHHWKHLKRGNVIKEVSQLRMHMIRHAYELGLVEDTSPWKERWKRKSA